MLHYPTVVDLPDDKREPHESNVTYATSASIIGARSHSVGSPPMSNPSSQTRNNETLLVLPRSRSAPTLVALEVESMAFAMVHSPNKDSVWRWGQPAFLMWERRDMSVSEVRIVLRRKGANACTIIADHVENNGLFMYKAVPAGTTPAADYFISIMSMDSTQIVRGDLFTVVAS
ncbi:hypothetical protein H257_00295 [Aphanomyces astaci]|uniref:Uncharacterized protein n=1 Tax=Aphanomyces astaci TaxID=112090 RepID=W4H9V0_APHAT|nr:hypothetical protein H257_00295 [Aphanomyces astaci]ETV88800.1 hypothetical protein H257_00295 [Aphanomyces astaci]|eukprot:XP_009821200.1 hypothetical protein H257_00295 [Aphanomyces astaci]